MTVRLRGERLQKTYGSVTALDDVSFELAAGRTLGIVGESGSGKSTLGRIVMRLTPPTGGRVLLDGVDTASGAGAARLRRAVQLIPQDPRTSLNPTLSVRTSLEFQLRAQRVPRSQWARRMEARLDQVSLSPAFLGAYPHELSGGQAQRIAIARAILNDPEVLVCDEAISALDKSVQAQVLNTLAMLQRDSGVAIVFISHDLSVVEHMADDVVVLHRGIAVDSGPALRVLSEPRDPYTRELLAARSETFLPHNPHHPHPKATQRGIQ